MSELESWYYAEAGQQRGPVTNERLHQMAGSGLLAPDAMVWREGLSDWVAARTVEGLFPMPPHPDGGPGAVPLSCQAPQIQYYNPRGADLAYAGFWWRVLAYLIDSLILAVPNFLINLASETVGHAQVIPFGRRSGIFLAQISTGAGLIQTTLSWLYFALMESSDKQATIGKMVCGLRVTDQAGGRIGFGRATGRYFGKLLSALIIYIGFIMAAFTERKQGLHDIMAGTLVVKKDLPVL